MTQNNNLPLHKTVHWRRFKIAANLLLKLEHMEDDKDLFNFDKIRCYRTYGGDLNGKNVTFSSYGNLSHSPWVTDNLYEVYEIPYRTNHSKIACEGEFLYLAHNVDFNYWIAGNITNSINAQVTLNTDHFTENYTFSVWGMYEIGGADDGNVVVYKKKKTESIDMGYKLSHKYSTPADSVGCRKQAYGLTEPQIIFKLKNTNENKKMFVDTKAVEIYKKKRK